MSAITEEGEWRCDEDFHQLIREKGREKGSKNFLLGTNTRATTHSECRPLASIDYREAEPAEHTQLRSEFAT